MDWSQFKDPVCHLCLADVVVPSSTQEVAGSSPFTGNILATQCTN